MTRRPFCCFGYDRLLLNKMGVVPEMVEFCSEVEYRSKQRLSGEADELRPGASCPFQKKEKVRTPKRSRSFSLPPSRSNSGGGVLIS